MISRYAGEVEIGYSVSIYLPHSELLHQAECTGRTAMTPLVSSSAV
jgi:hypothetical protein